MPPKAARAPVGKNASHARTSKAHKSFREVYDDTCRDKAAHPNSAFQRLLPEKKDVAFPGDVLDLTNNYVGDAGIVPVAAVLERCHSVKQVIVAKNGLRNKGIKALCTALAKHPGVTSLDVSENYISHGAATALESLLMENPRIVHIDFADTKLDVAERLRLKELAAQNASNKLPPSS
jgi:hypothetical protein